MAKGYTSIGHAVGLTAYTLFAQSPPQMVSSPGLFPGVAAQVEIESRV
jgi:hypothetical protein